MRNFTFDSALQLKDSYAVTASAAAQVSSSNKIVDVGSGALFKGIAVVDVSAIDISSTDELYTIIIQGSNSATFASGIENLAELDLGATASRKGSAKDSVVGRYEIPFQNEQADVLYQYIRAYTVVSGTTPTITHTIYAGRDYLAA